MKLPGELSDIFSPRTNPIGGPSPVHPSPVHPSTMQVPAHYPGTAAHSGGFRVTGSTMSPCRVPVQPSWVLQSQAAPRPGGSMSPQQVKRALVIPPISISENHKCIPHFLVQVGREPPPSLPGTGVGDTLVRGIAWEHPRRGTWHGGRLRAERDPRQGTDPPSPRTTSPAFPRSSQTSNSPGGVIYSIKGPGVDKEPLGIFSTGNPSLSPNPPTLCLQLKAFALDLSGMMLEDPTDLEIIVVDQNHNRSLFHPNAGTHWGAPPPTGTCVMTVDVTDADDPDTDNAVLWYSILEQGARGMFSINVTTGEICTVWPSLDCETIRVYNLRVQAADMSGDGLTTTAMAVIYLEDINNNLPEFTKEEVVGADTISTPLSPSSPWRWRRRQLGNPEGAFTTRTDPYTNDGVFSMAKVGVGQLGGSGRGMLLYDPADWLQLDPHTGTVRTKQELLHHSAFLQGFEPSVSATGTLSIKILEVNDHAPVLQLPAMPLCRQPGHSRILLLGATDNDWSSHSAPFHFQLSPQHLQLACNWNITCFNGEGWPGLGELSEGLYSLPLLLRDSGTPLQEQQQLLNVSVCCCGQEGTCEESVLAATTARASITLGALVIILSSSILLLGEHRQALRKGLLQCSQDDMRDNILNYDEQGGGEEDQDVYINQLRHPELFLPWVKPPVRRDAPLSSTTPLAPCKLPSSPSDIEDFINEGLEAANNHPSMPHYDTALIYDYEGSGSSASTLSSIVSSLMDEDQDYNYMSEWGPRFWCLADLYGQ
uniref:Cadherin domain-containing protein n=1 Tax=Strigops habroptila TaxID=2489341 RepID=A0A672TEX7_STRHB